MSGLYDAEVIRKKEYIGEKKVTNEKDTSSLFIIKGFGLEKSII